MMEKIQAARWLFIVLIVGFCVGVVLGYFYIVLIVGFCVGVVLGYLTQMLIEIWGKL